jgi:hypothetical protein
MGTTLIALAVAVAWLAQVPARTAEAPPTPDDRPRQPIAVAMAYARAMEAQDGEGVARLLDDDLRLSGDVCCPTKSSFLLMLDRFWATGAQSRVTLERVAGEVVSLRFQNNLATDWQAGIPPLRIDYQLQVRDGRITAIHGVADWASSAQREQAMSARVATAVARSTVAAAPAAPAVAHGSDTRRAGTVAPAAWVVGATLAAAISLWATLGHRPTSP